MKQHKAGDIVRSDDGELRLIISTDGAPNRYHTVWLVSCEHGHSVRLNSQVHEPDSLVMLDGEVICNLHDIITVWQKEEQDK